MSSSHGHGHHYIYSHLHPTASSSSPASAQLYADAHDHAHPPPALCIPPAPPNDWPYALDVHAAAVYSPSTSVSYAAFHHHNSPVEPSSQSYALAGALQASPKLALASANANGRPSADVSRRAHTTAGSMAAATTASAPGPDEQSRWAYAVQAYGQSELAASRSQQQQQQQQHAYLQAAGDSHCSQMLSVSGAPLQTDYGQSFPHPQNQNQNQAMLMQDAWMAQSAGRIQHAHPPPAATATPQPHPNSGEQLPVPVSNIVSPLPRTPAMPLSARSHHPGFALASNYSLPDAQQHQPHGHAHGHSPMGMGMAAPANGSHNTGVDAEFDAEADEDDDFFDDDEFEDDDGDGDGDDGEGSRGSYAHSSPTPELQYPPGTSGTPADFLRSDPVPGGAVVNCMVFDADGGVWPVEPGGPGGPSAVFLGRQSGGGGGSTTTVTHIGSPRARARGPPAHFSQASAARPTAMSNSAPGTNSGAHDKGKRAQNIRDADAADADSADRQHQTVKVLIQSTTPGEPPKKVKMHQCRICQKLFPRPSGLATHMNSHSGARPFKCPLQLCNKTFAVRSNARRHLRTHGVSVPPAALDKMGGGGPGGRAQAPQPFRVGFDTPVVVDVHDFGRTYVDGGGGGGSGSGSGSGSGTGRTTGGENGSSGGGNANGGGSASGKAQRLRWVPQSLASRSNAARLRSLSPSSDMADLDLDAEYDDDEGEDRDRDRRSGRRNRSGQNHSQSHMSMSPATSLSTNSTNSPRTPSLFSRRPPGPPLAHELKIAPVPLQTSAPSDASANPYAKYDERNSFAEAGTYPYHPEQWRCLPGPG